MSKKNVRISEYFLPLLKEVSDDIKLDSHKYSLRSALIKQCGSGIYTWLPLGLRVMNNISNIIKEEMEISGSIELLMPCIQQAELWKTSGRFDDYGKEMLKMQDRHGSEMLFGPTNEELITNLVKGCIKSYKELPKNLYHIQWKFRDEIRPRFGLMRGREFLMKDAYSFAETEEMAIRQYDDMFATYLRIFKRLGLDVVVSKADTGPIGGDLSHEFHLVTKSGAENAIYYDPELTNLINIFHNSSKENCYETINQIKKTYSVVEELHTDQNKDNLCVTKGIEVGHIFYFGNKYSKAMNATFLQNDGKEEFFYMGSYGIGISRLVAAIIEYSHDDKGIIWPKEVSPFKFGLINLNSNALYISENIFSNINNVLYDDTEDSAGMKFSKMDLIGIPYQIIVGKNSLSTGTVEIKERSTGIVRIISLDELHNDLSFSHCE